MVRAETTHTPFAVAAGSLVFAALLIAAYAWLFLGVRATLADTAALVGETQLLARNNAHIQTVRKIVRDTAALRGELNSYFVGEHDIVAFLEDVEALGTYAGADVSVRSVESAGPLAKDVPIEQLKMSLRADGALADVLHLLALLESLPKAITLEKAQIVRRASDGLWQGTFDLSVAQITIPPAEDE
ncbi:MAG: hypothetical protein Q8P16_00955 [bacterium]|nr:hypothetical protein [bacterium]